MNQRDFDAMYRRHYGDEKPPSLRTMAVLWALIGVLAVAGNYCLYRLIVWLIE